MNPAYTQVRFRAQPPATRFPATFGIVTACNPNGVTVSDEENVMLTARLQAMLEVAGDRFFPVTGGSSDFSHVEPGFGVQTDLETCLMLGKEFSQEAIFWICDGRCNLVDCATTKLQEIGSWSDLFAPFSA